jgi:hypothetical protein
MRSRAGRSAKHPPKILRPSDEVILRFINQVNYATSSQAAIGLGRAGSKTAVRSRMALLAGGADYVPGQWLYRFPMPSAASGNRLRIFAVGTRSRSVLTHDLGLPVKHNLPYKHVRLGYSFLRHALATTASVVAASCFDKRQSDIKLVRTLMSYDLARRQPKLPVIPDVWSLWMRNGKEQAIWWEVDCESESQRRWVKSLHEKVRYVQSGEYARVFHTSTILISFLVAGRTAQSAASRRTALIRWTNNSLAELGLEAYGSMFRFSSLVWSEDISDLGLYDSAIWHSVDSAIPVPLFPP